MFEKFFGNKPEDVQSEEEIVSQDEVLEEDGVEVESSPEQEDDGIDQTLEDLGELSPEAEEVVKRVQSGTGGRIATALVVAFLSLAPQKAEAGDKWSDFGRLAARRAAAGVAEGMRNNQAKRNQYDYADRKVGEAAALMHQLDILRADFMQLKEQYDQNKSRDNYKLLQRTAYDIKKVEQRISYLFKQANAAESRAHAYKQRNRNERADVRADIIEGGFRIWTRKKK